MRTIIKILSMPFVLLELGVIYLYKIFISPLFSRQCRFIPTCSTYAILAIKEFGVISGSMLAIKRVLKCNPRCECGFDPVPSNIKGDIKWLI